MKNLIREKKRELAGVPEKENFKSEVKKIYKSKIADVPTPGYTGHSSIYVQPVSYLNKDKILSELEKQELEEKAKFESIDNETVSGYYTKSKEAEKEDPDEVIRYFILHTNNFIVTLCCWIWRIQNWCEAEELLCNKFSRGFIESEKRNNVRTSIIFLCKKY